VTEQWEWMTELCVYQQHRPVSVNLAQRTVMSN